MVRVVPTEDSNPAVTPSEGQETQPSDDNVPAVQQQTPVEVVPKTGGDVAGAPAEDREMRLSNGTVPGAQQQQTLNEDGPLQDRPSNTAAEESHPMSDDAQAAPDASSAGLSQEGNDTAPVDPSSRQASETDEMRRQEEPTSGPLASTGQGSDPASSSAQDVSSVLDMDKDSGMTTFSLMRQDDPQPSLHEGDEIHIETSAEATEEEDDGEEDSELAGARSARRQTGAGIDRPGRQKLFRQNTGIGNAGGLGRTGGKKKKAPFQVPQTMYMGHPLGSAAAEFLERQQHRLAEVKTRREDVAGLVEMVMEHNSKSSGSELPDIDAVFPYRRERDNSQGDWCV